MAEGMVAVQGLVDPLSECLGHTGTGFGSDGDRGRGRDRQEGRLVLDRTFLAFDVADEGIQMSQAGWVGSVLGFLEITPQGTVLDLQGFQSLIQAVGRGTADFLELVLERRNPETLQL